MASTNLSDSYEKVVLVVALLIALALGFLAFSKMGKIEEDFVEPAPMNRPAPALPGEGKMDEASKQLVTTVSLPPATVEGGRKVDTFIGIPWFLKQDETTTVDLGNPDEPPVHEGIPNQWWLEHGINPGFADSPQRDADNDGFTNREEYEAETDPTLASSHPPLIDKLRVDQLIDNKFRLDFSGQDFAGGYKLKFYTNENGALREQTMDRFIPAGEGDASIFFAEPPAQFRFRLKAVEERQVENERTGVQTNENFAVVEDLKPNLKAAGTTYEIPYSGPGLVFSDYKAVLYLNAIGQADETFEVPVNTRFALPHDPDAADKPFLFKEVSNVGDVIIEWEEDGQTRFVSLQVPPQ